MHDGSLPIRFCQGFLGGAVEAGRIWEGAEGQVMALEVAPGGPDGVRLGRIPGQPLRGDP